MKTRFFSLLLSLSLFITGCSTEFYQLYKTTCNDALTEKNGNLVYEDENFKVNYNFWGENGLMSFRFYNKTGKDIYLDLGNSFFIVNGTANNYFQNRTFTESGGQISYVVNNYFNIAASASNTYSVAKQEDRIVCIPSLTSKIINEFNITETVYRHCDLLLYPKSVKPNTLKFSGKDSPFVFSNRLTYKVENSDIPVKINNEFYVSEISNFDESHFLTEGLTTFCNEKKAVYPKLYKDPSPEKFYIKYKQTDYEKH